MIGGRENRGRGTNPYRERKYRHAGVHRAIPQLPKSVNDVLNDFPQLSETSCPPYAARVGADAISVCVNNISELTKRFLTRRLRSHS